MDTFCTMPVELRKNSPQTKHTFDINELNIFPEPGDLGPKDCGVCYSCIRMRGSCINPKSELNQIYTNWYNEDILKLLNCPGCESGVDFAGAHMLDNKLHPNCCARE